MSALIESLDADVSRARDEVAVLEHLDDDAQRDALVSGRYDDRAGARMTRSDVVRMEKQIRAMVRSRSRLVSRRDRLVRKLAAQ